MVTETQIKEKALELGFHGVGIASVDGQDSAVSHLKSWLERGYHADMDWMTNPKRQDIKTLWPEVRSLICLALNYYTPQQHSQEQNHGKISRYAWGRDYAKNGNLITRNYGSWVFLGEILTNLPLEPDRPHSAHCGTCSRCLSACPTQAIVSPYVVDANRCIAYHTIENRAVTLPTEIAKNLQGWVAGCDICQDVCPWNQRFAQVTDVEDFQPRPENLSPRLEELANLPIEEWDRRFISSALRRIKPQQWRRNAQANLAHSPNPAQDDN